MNNPVQLFDPDGRAACKTRAECHKQVPHEKVLKVYTDDGDSWTDYALTAASFVPVVGDAVDLAVTAYEVGKNVYNGDYEAAATAAAAGALTLVPGGRQASCYGLQLRGRRRPHLLRDRSRPVGAQYAL